MLDFHTLYERYASQVRLFALFLSGDTALADDITSDTFVRAWVARDRIEHVTVKGYLFTIERNLYHDLRSIGVSERRLSLVFREQLRMSPLMWLRIRRLQAAVRALYNGVEVPWAELALRCGYYDQSHFANDFGAFSGINPTTYSVHRGPWQNHIPVL